MRLFPILVWSKIGICGRYFSARFEGASSRKTTRHKGLNLKSCMPQDLIFLPVLCAGAAMQARSRDLPPSRTYPQRHLPNIQKPTDMQSFKDPHSRSPQTQYLAASKKTFRPRALSGPGSSTLRTQPSFEARHVYPKYKSCHY